MSKHELEQDELDEQEGSPLPDREAMSTLPFPDGIGLVPPDFADVNHLHPPEAPGEDT